MTPRKKECEVSVETAFLSWWTIRGSNEMFGVKNAEKWRVAALSGARDTQIDTQKIDRRSIVLWLWYVSKSISFNISYS
jgi:hypothetical protein